MKREIPAGRAVPADWLSNFDRYLISEGTHERAYEKLGAHLVRFEGHGRRRFRRLGPQCPTGYDNR